MSCIGCGDVPAAFLFLAAGLKGSGFGVEWVKGIVFGGDAAWRFSRNIWRADDAGHRARVEEVLGWVAKRFPDLVPRIAWNQPMFTDHGTFIIGFRIAKKHLAVAPERVGIGRFSDEIEQLGYSRSRELLRIPWDKPVDYALLEKIIEFNISDKADCKTFWRKMNQ